MDIKQKVLRKFNRVLISSSNTGEPKSLNSILVKSVIEKVDVTLSLDDILIISFVDQNHWMLMTLDTVFWCNNQNVQSIGVDDLKRAKLDLLINKKLGFDSKVGFNILSLIMKTNDVVNIKIEGGSPLEATIALINKLISVREQK